MGIELCVVFINMRKRVGVGENLITDAPPASIIKKLLPVSVTRPLMYAYIKNSLYLIMNLFLNLLLCAWQIATASASAASSGRGNFF